MKEKTKEGLLSVILVVVFLSITLLLARFHEPATTTHDGYYRPVYTPRSI